MARSIESIILFQIDKTSKIAKQYSQREFDRLRLGITVDQWVLLKIIHESENISQKELADRSFRDPASITRTLDLLHTMKLVDREPVPNNRRQYQILLSETGKRFVDTHMPMIQRHRQKSIAGMSEKELERLSSLLLKIQENMR